MQRTFTLYNVEACCIVYILPQGYKIVASVLSCLTPALPNDHEIVAFDSQVWKSGSLARIRFKLPSGVVGQAEFKRRHIDGEVGHSSLISQICCECPLPVVSHVVVSTCYSSVDQSLLLRSVVCTVCGDSRLNTRKWTLALEITNDRNPTNWSCEPRDFLPSLLPSMTLLNSFTHIATSSWKAIS